MVSGKAAKLNKDPQKANPAERWGRKAKSLQWGLVLHHDSLAAGAQAALFLLWRNSSLLTGWSSEQAFRFLGGWRQSKEAVGVAQVMAYRQQGLSLLEQGLCVAAEAEFRRWYDAVRSEGSVAELLSPLNALASAAMDRKDYARALAYLEEALSYLPDPDVAVQDELKCHLNLVVTHVHSANLDKALHHAQKARALAADGSPPDLLGLAWLDLSWVHLKRCEWTEAERAAWSALRLFTSIGDLEHMARALGNLGYIHLERGSLILADRNLSRALELNNQIGRGASAYNHTELGRLCFQQGRLKEAVFHGRRALTLLLHNFAAVDKSEVAVLSELFGALFAAAGQQAAALKYLNRAAAYFSQLGLLSEWSRVTGRIGQLLRQGRGAPSLELGGEEAQLHFLTVVLDLTDEIESVDPHLRGHSERVTHLAILIGQALGLDDAELQNLQWAARLHDVGYVAVDAEILLKPGPLTASERARVAVHPTIGEEILRPYGLAAPVLAAIRHHHEHYDGQGYPGGLAGEEIPLFARIIHVADVYDALTCARSFRDAMTHREAIATMQIMAGSQLDPKVVDAFFELHHPCGG